MCIIVHKPQDASIKEETLIECFARNPEGAGVSYVDDGELVITKGIFSAERLIDIVNLHMDKEMIIHFRVASKGMVKNSFNCHPFFIEAWEEAWRDGGKMEYRFHFAIAHNGTLDWPHSDTHSDTNMFVLDFLTPMFKSMPWALDYEWGRIALARTILHDRRMNKMVIMRYDRMEDKTSTYIINDKCGVYENGIWFSNDSYKPKPKWEEAYKAPKGYSQAELDYLNFWLDPDENGWMWSFKYHAFININSFVITRDIPRTKPVYTQKPEFKFPSLNGLSILPNSEVMDILISSKLKIKEAEESVKAQQLFIDGVQEEYKSIGLYHLNVDERDLICKFATSVIMWECPSKKDAKRELKTMTNSEKVENLRRWIIALFDSERETPKLGDMTNQELDVWILNKLKSGDLTMAKFTEEYELKEKASMNSIIPTN